MTTIIFAIVVLGLLGALFGAVLGLASKIFHVAQDPRLEQVRALAGSSLERALLLSLEETADYVSSRGKYLHPRTANTILWLKSQLGVQ